MNDLNTSDNLTPQSVESNLSKKQKSKTVTGKPRGATYDGNLCMICSDRASGFHYGVLACEGCKGFFKRVCKEKMKSLGSEGNNSIVNLQSKRQCVFGGNCEINVRTRNRCQYCRIQKCIDLGMSKDGIKLGRRSKKFKQNLNQAVSQKAEETKQESETNSDLYKQQIIAILQDNKLVIKAIDILSAAAAASVNNPQVDANCLLLPPGTSNSQMPTVPVLLLNNSNITVNPLVFLNNNSSISIDNKQTESVLENVLRAFKETKNVFSDNDDNINFSESNFINTNHNLNDIFSKGLVDVLNSTKFLEHVNFLIENTVLFAKNVPFFMNINETDRITLLKSSVFEIICLRHSSFYKYSSSISSLSTLADCALAYNNFDNDQTNLIESKFYLPFLNCWLTCDWICDKFQDIKKFIHMLFEFYFYFNSICLNESEFAVFCSFLLFDSENQSLIETEKIKNYRCLYQEVLLNQLEKKHSRMEQNKVLTKEFLNLWLNNCCKKLRDLNEEHSNILNKLKQFVQFPDLYAELYNLYI